MTPRPEDTIRLDPVLFDALHLSALDFGGIGRGSQTDVDGSPLCVIGHAWSITRAIPEMGECAFSLLSEYATSDGWATRNDAALEGIQRHRVPFETWCEMVGVDVLP